MKSKIAIYIFLFLFVSSDSFSSNVFNFLRDVSGARAAGLAGSFVTVENDVTSIYYNPATLQTSEDNNISFTFFKHALDINSGNVVFKLPYQWENGTFAANAVFTNFGSFDYTDKNGINNGTFSANDISLGVHYSNQLDTNLFYGVGLKYIFSNIEKYSSSAMALDFGLFYKMKDGRTNLGMSILNAGFQLSSFDGYTEKLPLDVRIGFNHRLKGMPLLFNASFNHLADRTSTFFSKFRSFSVGGEFNVGKYVDLRLGFDNHIRTVLTNEVEKGFSGFSGGLGIKTDYLNFDYALSVYNSAVTLHRFSVSLNI
jgi:hypothetical protein